jgi:hypothetical protein
MIHQPNLETSSKCAVLPLVPRFPLLAPVQVYLLWPFSNGVRWPPFQSNGRPISSNTGFWLTLPVPLSWQLASVGPCASFSCFRCMLVGSRCNLTRCESCWKPHHSLTVNGGGMLFFYFGKWHKSIHVDFCACLALVPFSTLEQ